MDDAAKHTCYLNRSSVRSSLIGASDEDREIAEEFLAEIDALPIVTVDTSRQKEALSAAEYYISCLERVVGGKPCRDVPEAQSAWLSARNAID